ncbi:MAG: hypothetical protein CM1200mP30_07770 [Pseudomonadota bacterium]|nr:MAG: hypothetical protein CM1200mP30_07770 [Pseudomonadota bacterium]
MCLNSRRWGYESSLKRNPELVRNDVQRVITNAAGERSFWGCITSKGLVEGNATQNLKGVSNLYLH